MKNYQELNKYLPQYIDNIAQWHHDRNLIDGATNNSQFGKLLEEMMELYMTINQNRPLSPEVAVAEVTGILGNLLDKGRISVAPKGKSVKDDIGDCIVVLVNIAEREQVTIQGCVETAWEDIKDRKGKMVNGVFVKEQDADYAQCTDTQGV
jgi:NTP pyrophosphatase (non-canonical NTP hydrolase)